MAFIGENLEEHARQEPEAAALICAGKIWSWQAFLDQVHALESGLREVSAPKSRVALVLNDPMSLLAAFFACARTDRIALVCDPGWPEAVLKSLLEAAAPAFVLNEATHRALAHQRPESPILSKGSPAPQDSSHFYAGFTSGTTSLPKGFVRTHASWLKSFQITDREINKGALSRVVLAGRFSHSLHLYGAVHALDRGLSVEMAGAFDPRRILEAVSAGPQKTALYATPTQLQLISEAALRHSPSPHRETGNLKTVFSSGAKWQDKDRQALAEAFPNARLIEFYGASETSFITWAPPEDKTPAGSVGRAAPGVEILIGSPRAPAPAGQQGAIWVKSGLLFSGYICGEAKDTKWQDGWLAFGDHGYRDEMGYLFLTGRGNRMIVTSGLNVYPEEIETVLQSHDKVRNAVVYGVPDLRRGQRLEAIVELAGGLPDAEGCLMAYCRKHAGRAKTPRAIRAVGALPLTPGGKPDLQKILKQIASENAATSRAEES